MTAAMLDAGARQVDRRAPAVVAASEHRDAPAGRCRVAVEVGAHGGCQHDAGPVVAGEHDRPLDGAGGQHRPLGHDAPQALPRLVRWRHRQVVGDALDGRVGAAVVHAEHRAARHDAHARHALQLRAASRRPTRDRARRRSRSAPTADARPAAQSSSHRITRAPARPAASAAASPAGPAPITSTSQKA